MFANLLLEAIESPEITLQFIDLQFILNANQIRKFVNDTHYINAYDTDVYVNLSTSLLQI